MQHVLNFLSCVTIIFCTNLQISNLSTFICLLYSLEVIPGDSYQVQKMGDDQSGFYNKVVFNNTTNDKQEAEEEEKKTTDGKSKSSQEGGAQQLLSKKERQKLKRKAKK